MPPASPDSVLLILPWSPTLPGGVSIVAQHLVTEFERRGLRPVIVVDDWASKKAGVHESGAPKFRFALLGATSLKSVLTAIVMAPLRLTRTWRFLRSQRAAAVSFQYPGLQALSVAVLKRLGLYRGTLSLSFHGTDLRPYGNAVEAWAWRFIVGAADGVSACSRSLAAGVAGTHGLAAQDVRVLYNGVDTAVFHPGAEAASALPCARPYVASIGSFIERKDHATLLEAFRRLSAEFPDLSLVIVGMWGPLLDATLDAARAMGLADRVQCLINFTPAEIARLLANAEACVQPSKDEPFGMAVLEAAACGAPVIASRVGGHAELVTDGVTGALFEAGDVDACAEALRQVLRDPVGAREKAERFRAEVVRGFSWRATADGYARIMGL